MSHITPAFDGSRLAAGAPPIVRRMVDDYEAWITEVWPAFVEAADTGEPFTIDAVSRAHNLPDPPSPQSQWGSLPSRLQNAGLVRHHGFDTSQRAGHSAVHEWIGIPPDQRQAVAERRRIERAERRAQLAAARKAAAA